MEFYGIETNNMELERLMWEKSQGKEIKAVDGKLVAVETPEYIRNKRIKELKNWFATEYTYKEQKYRRLISMGKADDDGLSAEYKLDELYHMAEQNRLEIQSLGG